MEAYRVYPQVRTEEVTAHAAAMAWKLQGADPEAGVFVVVALNMLDPLLDAMEGPQPAPSRGPRYETLLLNPHPDCLAEITIEYPYLQERYEFFRLEMKAEETLDRPKVQYDLLHEAEAKYLESTGEKMAHWQRRMMARYTRNLAHINGELTCGVYDMAVAARSVVDDNYGWEVWSMANRYLAQQEVSELDTVRLGASEIWINTKKLRIRRRLPRSQAAPEAHGSEAAQAGKYSRGVGATSNLTGDAICSYPPEDLVIEEWRALSEAEGESDPIRGARARGAAYDLDSRRHRYPRDDSQLASAKDLRAQGGPARGRRGRRRGDLRRRSRGPLHLPDDVARRASERI